MVTAVFTLAVRVYFVLGLSATPCVGPPVEVLVGSVGFVRSDCVPLVFCVVSGVHVVLPSHCEQVQPVIPFSKPLLISG